MAVLYRNLRSSEAFVRHAIMRMICNLNPMTVFQKQYGDVTRLKGIFYRSIQQCPGVKVIMWPCKVSILHMSCVARKHVFGVSDQVRHKPLCTATEDGCRLEFQMSDEEGLYYLCSENKGSNQLCSYCVADLRLCFRICNKSKCSHEAAHESSAHCSNFTLW